MLRYSLDFPDHRTEEFKIFRVKSTWPRIAGTALVSNTDWGPCHQQYPVIKSMPVALVWPPLDSWSLGPGWSTPCRESPCCQTASTPCMCHVLLQGSPSHLTPLSNGAQGTIWLSVHVSNFLTEPVCSNLKSMPSCSWVQVPHSCLWFIPTHGQPHPPPPGSASIYHCISGRC